METTVTTSGTGPVDLDVTTYDAQPMQHLRAPAVGGNVGVDLEAEVIHGVILAEEGPFRVRPGEFEASAIRRVTALAREQRDGLIVHFGHHEDGSEALGWLLGRIKNVRNDTVLRDGVERAVSRGDLHVDPASHLSPRGDLGKYVLAQAKSDPDAVGMSLVLAAEITYRLDGRGRRKLAEDGSELPPLWRPVELGGVDVVARGEATRSLLSAGGQDTGEAPPDAAGATQGGDVRRLELEIAILEMETG